ncbi:hypothetical protein Q9L58_008850 [Maublancomyces gigas]|uniref:Uncharacterized protein n=1 Tax=Discina gigas TaxID=1032678 RepID=A0ABR3G8M3_9PEZI
MSQNLKKTITPHCPEHGGKQGNCHFDNKLGYCETHQTACESSKIIHLQSETCTCHTCNNTEPPPELQPNIDQAPRAPPEPDPQASPHREQTQPISLEPWPPGLLELFAPNLTAARPGTCACNGHGHGLDLDAEWKKLVHAADYLQDLFSLLLEVVAPLTSSFIQRLLQFINWIIFFVSKFWMPWIPGPLD